jgi:hypothetical protein
MFLKYLLCQMGPPPRRMRGPLGTLGCQRWWGAGSTGAKPCTIDGADHTLGAPAAVALLLGHRRPWPCAFCIDAVAPWRQQGQCSLAPTTTFPLDAGANLSSWLRRRPFFLAPVATFLLGAGNALAPKRQRAPLILWHRQHPCSIWRRQPNAGIKRGPARPSQF